MQQYKLDAVFEDLTKFCHFAKKDDYIQVAEWHNGEGWSIDIAGKKTIDLTHGELRAIECLTKVPNE